MCCKLIAQASHTKVTPLINVAPAVVPISAFYCTKTLAICVYMHGCNFHRLIKLASSQLNYLIAVGAIILYLDSVLFVIPSAGPNVVTAICNITPWLTAIGYSLCYGTILMKMARVYYIFNNPSVNKKVRECNADCVHVHGTKNCLCTA